MIVVDGFFIVGTIVAVLGVLGSLVAVARSNYLSDLSSLGVIGMFLYMLTMGIWHVLSFNPQQPVPVRVEFASYAVTAVFLAVAGYLWCWVGRHNRWSNLAAVAVIATLWVMMWRMNTLWYHGPNTMFNQ